MTPEFREQVNSARRAGYSDTDIVQFLGQQDPRFGQALESGYKPSEILNFVAPPPTTGEQITRQLGVVGRATAPYATTAVAAAPLGPIAIIGALLAQGLSDAAITAYNSLVPADKQLPTTSEGIRALYDMVGMGGVKPETRGERMLAAGSEALSGTVPSVAAGRVGSTLTGGAGAVSKEVSRAPLTQIISAPPIAGGTQFVAEATGNPLLAILTGVGSGAAVGVRPRIRGEGPSRADIQAQIADKYKVLNTSGVKIDDSGFRSAITGDIFNDLRAEGYSPTNPKLQGITNLISDLSSNTQPKDIVELQAIRKQITASASPNEPEAYRMMKIIRDRFDNYIENVPENQVIAGDKTALSAWGQARTLFQKDRKSEIFQDILDKAPVSKGQFSQSGMENYLYNELKKIARNDDVLRSFTKTEQEAIKKAAEGTGLQNALKFIGRFAPTGVIPGFGTAGVFALDPALGGTLGAATFGARMGAEQMRIGSVQRIIDQILSGQPQPSPMVNVPITTMRGLLSTQTE